MLASSLLKSVQQSFAQWYPNERGPFLHSLEAGGLKLNFSSHSPLSPKQAAYLALAQKSAQQWLKQFKPFRSSNLIKMFNEGLLVDWISQFSPRIPRETWVQSLEHLRHRSYENRKLKLNLIITEGQGSFDFLDSELQKIFDPLAGDPSVYFRVDQDFHFLAYEELETPKGVRDEGGILAPECMQSFLALLGPGDLFLHYNTYGEILVASRDGLLARYRRGHWLLYEPQDLYPIFCSLFCDEGLGKNILELLFELSYRRHGALLIFDPSHALLAHISNPEVLSREKQDTTSAHQLLNPIVEQIDLASPWARERRKHLVLELAEIDGAVVFDAHHILAFGAMIEPFGIRTRCYGTRTLAALSAAARQTIACKVSSEGDIVIYFQESDAEGILTELRIF